MPSFRLSAEARSDLRDIARYIAADNPDAAHRLIAEFTDAFIRLGEQPHMGRERPELAESLRSWPVGRYLVLYLPTSPTTIVRVLSAARHLPALFD